MPFILASGAPKSMAYLLCLRFDSVEKKTKFHSRERCGGCEKSRFLRTDLTDLFRRWELYRVNFARKNWLVEVRWISYMWLYRRGVQIKLFCNPSFNSATLAWKRFNSTREKKLVEQKEFTLTHLRVSISFLLSIDFSCYQCLYKFVQRK